MKRLLSEVDERRHFEPAFSRKMILQLLDQLQEGSTPRSKWRDELRMHGTIIPIDETVMNVHVCDLLLKKKLDISEKMVILSRTQADPSFGT
jgi:hypothetical protein